MNSEIYCAQISAGLARMVVEVRQNTGINTLSNPIHAEEFIREFFNCLYGWRLRNANVADPNARSIDLLDLENHVVVQVSADTFIIVCCFGFCLLILLLRPSGSR